eukprot:15038504-Alexandrium_andersonii.AAC.1
MSIKFDYMSRLPWHMVGVAHADENAARECARRCLRMFDPSTGASSHHRLTWKYLRPGCAFRDQLELFCAGSQRMSLS